MKITQRPELYDWLYSDFVDDIPMYLKFAETHDTVLECGVGTGRIALPLVQNGKVVYGIDNSMPMLDHFQRKLSNFPEIQSDQIHIQFSDMRDFNLGQRFSFVFVPFSTFNYLLTVEDQRSTLTSIHNHLEVHGTLVLEILSFSLEPYWFRGEPTLRKIKEKADHQKCEIIELWKEASFDSSKQLVMERRYFKVFDEEGTLIREERVYWENRFFFLGELQLLLELVGFEIVDVYGDFNFSPYHHSSEIAVVVAKPK